MKNSFALFLLFLGSFSLFSQPNFYANEKFSEADTLRGMLRPERTCFDVTFYDINIDIDIEKRFINGYVDIHFQAVEDFKTLQIDLFENMKLKSIVGSEQPLLTERRHDAVFVHFPAEIKKGTENKIRVNYSGFPTVARRAPWDGGFVFKKDKERRPWVGVACEGDGASLWWPNKDHLSDEPDSVAINVTIPSDLVCASNGNLRETVEKAKGKTEWKWFVSYPINNYNVSVTIGHFAHFSDHYISEDNDTLELDYYVLDYNLEKAKKQFEQVKPMLGCYEKLMGKYPFWEDGFSMIETPYLGMEHQSGIAYGNQYKRGYLGGMIPSDMDWDYIIIHESGHEYFGNSVSVTDHCDMWIHESFTTYLEALYVECLFGYEDYIRYLISQRKFIRNARPMVGPRDVNFKEFGSSDHYYKGAWVLHTFRHALMDDELFFKFFRDYYDRYKKEETSTQEFMDFVKNYFEKDWTGFWEQYLHYPNLPILKYSLQKTDKGVKVSYEWEAQAKGFEMPAYIMHNGEKKTVYPKVGQKQELVLEGVKISEVSAGQAFFLIDSSF